MRLEKLTLQQFGNVVTTETPRRPYMPPSLVDEPRAAPAAPPPPPSFSENDLKNAEQEGYRKGFIEGTKEGNLQAQGEQAEVDRKLSEAVEQMAGHLNVLIAEYNAFAEAQKAQLPRIALAVARKVAGDALQANALPLIESAVIACVEKVLGEPEISVTVNDKLSDAMENRLVAHFANNNAPGEISIHGDASIAPGDCRIEWANGKATRSVQALWEQVEALIEEQTGVSLTAPAIETPAAAALPPEASAEAAVTLNPDTTSEGA